MRPAGLSIAVLLCCVGASAQALQLTLPTNARQTASRDTALEQVSIAVTPFQDGMDGVEIAEGPVTRRAYRIPASDVTPLQILRPLRDQVEAAGYDILLDCAEDICGGFDFRFAIDVLPAPNMYVNIRNYHFVSARHPGTGAFVTLLASAAAGAGYLQIVQVGKQAVNASQTAAEKVGATDTTTPAPDIPVIPADTGDLEARLMEHGSVVLKSLDFAVGTTSIGDADAPELAALANLLQTRPNLRIAIVGHTDTIGGLDTNVSVSRARAQAVRSALVEDYGAPADRIEAGGMGYLSPIASNLTPEGREANRRVEVIVVDENE
jgi:outer membrane protein OmpA-like peptidoglycan-associated protein